MSTLWIIRHGQASFGDSDYDRLSERGRMQCRILGRFLEKTGVSFQSVLTGDMRRQTETADVVLNEMSGSSSILQRNIDTAFNEYDHHSIITALLPVLIEEEPEIKEVLPHIFKDNSKFQKMFGKILNRWISGNYEIPDTESFREYALRVEQGFNRTVMPAEKGKDTAIFTSGGVVSIAMKISLGLTDQEAMRLGWWVKNTSVTKLGWRNGRFNLLEFNSLAHLELENRPELMTYR